MLLNSWLKPFRNLRQTQSRVDHSRRKTRRSKSNNAVHRPAEVLESRQLLTTFTVNSLLDTGDALPGDGVADDGNGNVTLRAAIEEANALGGANTIEFSAVDATGAVNFHDATPDIIALSGTQLDISSDITLSGPGADLLTVSGNNASRIFEITNGNHDVTFDSLTIADGNSGGGAAIRNPTSAGIVTIRDSVISGNTSTGAEGSINTRVNSTLRVINSTFDNNRVVGGQGGAIFAFRADVTVTGSTFSNNNASSAGGAIVLRGSTIAIANSTFSGNRSGISGGALFGDSASTASLTNSTFTGNRAFTAGGAVSGLGTLTIYNSIVAGNTVRSNDDNIEDPGTAVNSLIGGDVSTILDTQLADNGGPTLTHTLIAGSPGINAGDDSLAVDTDGNALTTDQRGEDRFVGTVDIGAFEFREAASLAVTTDQDVVDAADGVTSLREAITFANSNPNFSEITFGDGSGLPGGTDFTDGTADIITLNGSQLIADSELTVTGPGADLLTVSGGGQSRVFRVTAGSSDVSIESLSIADGQAQNGGAISNLSPLTLRNVVLSDNSADFRGGAIRAESLLTVFDSTFSNNQAETGGAIFTEQTSIGINRTTLSGNTATELGGAIFGSGGNFNNPIRISNSTLSGNSSTNAGGGAIANNDSNRIEIVNSTLTGNSALGRGQAIRNRGNMFIDNSIVAGNGAVISTDDIFRLGISPVTRRSSIVGGDISTILDTNLADNGGPTLTHALIPGSPAVNAGDDLLAVDTDGNALTTDQRGEGRFLGTVDIGALEVENLAPIANAGGAYTVDEGSDVTLDGSGSSDPNDAIVDYEWDFNYDGTTFDVDATGATPDFTGIDDGTVSVALRVKDSFGAESEIVTTTVEVSNVDPAISGLTTDSAKLESKSDDGVVTLNGSVTDAGSIDTHEVVVDWGDGTVETVVAASDLNALPDFSGTQHTYAAGGIYTVTVTVTDDDGGTVSQTTSAVVQGVGLVDGVLYIIGTNGDDSVSLKEGHHGTQLKVRAKFDGGPTQNSYFDIADIDRIEMHLCDGDDYASLTHSHWWHQHSVDIPATIYGGDGNDVLKGGSQADVIDGGDGNDCLHGNSGDDTIHGGNGHDWIDGDGGNDIVYAGAGNDQVWGGSGEDILLGQSGNDWLFGGWHRDIIIAGEGADRLFGQSYDDVLITGDTNWDNDESALKTMRDLWTGSGSAWNRAQAIQDEGLEVFHDDDVDKAWGGWGLDWMLFDSEKDRVFC